MSEQQPDAAQTASRRFNDALDKEIARLIKFSRAALAERIVLDVFGRLYLHPFDDAVHASLAEAIDGLIPNLRACEASAMARRSSERMGKFLALMREREKARAEGRRPPPLPKQRKRRKSRKVIRHRIKLVKP